jgi:hypothetical protein
MVMVIVMLPRAASQCAAVITRSACVSMRACMLLLMQTSALKRANRVYNWSLVTTDSHLIPCRLSMLRIRFVRVCWC